MTVYVGNAVCDENGHARGGQPGNQTGKELRIQPWYLNAKGWRVFRAKDSEVAKKIAWDCKAACENMAIGYNQSKRNTLYSAAKPLGFDCARVTKLCECDCSSLVRVCILYAGIKINDFNTTSEVKTLMKTGKFTELTEDKYTKQSAYLKEGDILVTAVKGHTAVVLNDGDKAEKDPEPTPTPEPAPAPSTDAYVLVLGSVRVRKSAPDGACIMIAHKGDKLPYLGETVTLSDCAEWYYVSTENGKGYISAFTNKKKKYTKLIGA